MRKNSYFFRKGVVMALSLAVFASSDCFVNMGNFRVNTAKANVVQEEKDKAGDKGTDIVVDVQEQKPANYSSEKVSELLMEEMKNADESIEKTVGDNDEDNLDKNEIVRFIVTLKADSLLEKVDDLDDYSKSEQKKEKKILSKQKTIINKVEEITGKKVINQSAFLVNTFSIEGKRSDEKKIRKISGVENVYEAKNYELDMTTATDIANVAQVWEMENGTYDGRGVLVSVIDSGVNWEHKDMNLDEGCAKYTKDEMQQKIDLLGHGKWYSDKVPFGYSYSDGSCEIDNDGNTHGYHVSGIVAANGDSKNGGVRGVAPNAQILAMQVIAPSGGGYTDDIIKAIEDSVKLGADIINMSLGHENGFSSNQDYLQQAVERAKENGVLCCVSAGNSTLSTSAEGTEEVTNDFTMVDTGCVSSPSTAKGALSVASVDSYGRTISKLDLEMGTETLEIEGKEFYREEWKNIKDAKIVFAGLGSEGFVDKETMQGNIALIKRGGDITFDSKIVNAYNMGAIGVIIYNNEDTDDIPMSVTASNNAKIPAIIISGNAGNKLKQEVADTEAKVSYKKITRGIVVVPNTELNTSYFSSWGPTSSLEIKPEISAPGGNIYSLDYGTDGYQTMSGTSMSSPFMAGSEALILQSLKKKGIELSGAELVEFLKYTAINTAIPVIDNSHDVPFSVRQQGAGMVNVENAVKNNVLVTCDGMATAALKEIGRNTEFTLTFKNYGNTDAIYTMDTEKVYRDHTDAETKLYYIERVTGAKITYSSDKVVVPAGGTAQITVTLQIMDGVEKQSFIESFLSFKGEGDTVDLGMPVLAFYGDWGKDNIMDVPYYENTETNGSDLPDLLNLQSVPRGYQGYTTCLVGSDRGSFYALGEKTYNDSKNNGGWAGRRYIDSDSISISPNDDGFFDYCIPAITFLRDAKKVTMQVLDKEKNVIRTIGSLDEQTKMMFAGMNDQNVSQLLANDTTSLLWAGQLYNQRTGKLETVEEGQYYIRVIAETDSKYTKSQTIDMPVKVDLTKPEFKQCNIIKKADGTYALKYSADDENGMWFFVSYYVNGTSYGYSDTFFEWDETDDSYTIDLNGIKDDRTNSVAIMVSDEAGNTITQEFFFRTQENIEEPTEVIYDNFSTDKDVFYPSRGGIIDWVYTVTGRAPQGTSITIDGVKAEIKNGEFRCPIKLEGQSTKVPVLVKDPQGNVIVDKEIEIFIDTTNPELYLNVEPSYVEEKLNNYRYVTKYNQGDLKERVETIQGKKVTLGADEIPVTIYVKDESVERVEVTYQDENDVPHNETYSLDDNNEANVIIPLVTEQGASVTVSAFDQAGNFLMASFSVYTKKFADLAKDKFDIYPDNFGVYNTVSEDLTDKNHMITLTGYISYEVDTFTMNGDKVEVEKDGSGRFSYDFKLKKGMNTLKVYAEDKGKVMLDYYAKFEYDGEAPNLQVNTLSPKMDGKIYTNQKEFKINAKATDVFDYFTFYVNDQVILATKEFQSPVNGSEVAQREVEHTIELNEGENVIWLEVYDIMSKSSEEYLTVVYDVTPPNISTVTTKNGKPDIQTQDTDIDYYEYSLDGTNYKVYTADETITRNAVTYFRAVDYAGNVSNTVPYQELSISKFSLGKTSEQVVNNKISIVTDVTGGTNHYLYSYEIRDAKGNVIATREYLEKSDFIWIPKKAGNYQIKVKVRDGNNEEITKVKTLTIKSNQLKVKSISLSKKIIKKYSTVSISAKAINGVKDYQFKYVIRQKNKKPKTIQEYSKLSKANWTPVKNGIYTIYVYVKDATGKVSYTTKKIKVK